MTRTTKLLGFLSLALLLPLAPFADAGHVVFDVDPCKMGVDTPVGGGVAGPRLCRDGEPVPECWRYERDGMPVPVPDPARCPGEGDASCLGFGSLVRVYAVGFESQIGRAAAATRWGASASADGAQQQASVGTLVDEGTLLGECKANLENDCSARAHGEAVGVSLLGGLVTADVLESRVALSCDAAPVVETRFKNVVVGGVPMDPLVHPGSRVVVPGVGVVTFGVTETLVTPTGSWYASATALRIDLVDATGTPQGVVLVGHAAAQLR